MERFFFSCCSTIEYSTDTSGLFLQLVGTAHIERKQGINQVFLRGNLPSREPTVGISLCVRTELRAHQLKKIDARASLGRH